MKKVSRIVSFLALYCLLVGLVPSNSFAASKVKVAKTTTKFYLSNAYMYKGNALLLGNNTKYINSKGKSTTVQLSENFLESDKYVNGAYVQQSPYYQGMGSTYSLFDLNKGKKVVGKINLKNEDKIKGNIAKWLNNKVDKKNIYINEVGQVGNWILFLEYIQNTDNFIFGAYNINSNKIYKANDYIGNENAYEDLKGNLYINQGNSLIHLSKNGKVEKRTVSNLGNNFKVSNDGQYITTGNSILKLNKTKKKYEVKKVNGTLKASTTDINGNVWALVGSGKKVYVEKLVKDKFEVRYEVNSDANGLFVYDDKNMIVNAKHKEVADSRITIIH